jgi:hypothetical protein
MHELFKLAESWYPILAVIYYVIKIWDYLFTKFRK